MGKTEDMKPFSGFDAVFAQFSNNNNATNSIADLSSRSIEDSDDSDSSIDLSLGKNKNTISENPDDLESTSNEGDDDADGSNEIDDSDSSDQDSNNDGNPNSNPGVDVSDGVEVSDFFDVFSEELGWDVEDDKKPKSIEELVEYVKGVIDDRSIPTFANDTVAELNEFVKNGGDAIDYLQTLVEIDNYDNIDLDDVDDQKKIVTERMRHIGLSDVAISKKLKKYEDADILEDEAEEALEYMQNIKTEERNNKIESQKIAAKETEKKQREFYKNIVDGLDSMTNVRGIPVSKEDVKKLKTYILNVESDGSTKFQKDYKTSINNFLESAYFTMNKDKFINSAKQVGENNAISKFKDKLGKPRIKGSMQDREDGAPTPVWAIGSFLKNKNNN